MMARNFVEGIYRSAHLEQVITERVPFASREVSYLKALRAGVVTHLAFYERASDVWPVGVRPMEGTPHMGVGEVLIVHLEVKEMEP